MTYKGHIKNGVVVLDEPVNLPDGAEVRVEPVSDSGGDSGGDGKPDIWQKLLELAGKGKGLPSDGAAQHDHYIYGTPKR